jgi:hypothetical protein
MYRVNTPSLTVLVAIKCIFYNLLVHFKIALLRTFASLVTDRDHPSLRCIVICLMPKQFPHFLVKLACNFMLLNSAGAEILVSFFISLDS